MTCREKLALEHPERIDSECVGGCMCCPHTYEYLDAPEYCDNGISRSACVSCWDREIPVSPDGNAPKILDSGDRTEFESGAVRDMRTGKGRCDLMPLDVVSEWYHCEHGDDGANPRRWVFMHISNFICTGVEGHLFRALEASELFENSETMFLEVAKHFEEGCIKYGENNWRKGIPAKCYIDSAIRHYLKHMRGDKDEPHDRAFCWNILCCIWTIRHHPELNNYSQTWKQPKRITPANGLATRYIKKEVEYDG